MSALTFGNVQMFEFVQEFYGYKLFDFLVETENFKYVYMCNTSMYKG
jgi:hypothetical protein